MINKYMDASIQGASVVRRNLDMNLFYQIAIQIPCPEEQKIIGQYFEKLDKLISFHQQKYESLLKVKKSMLEKMFPKEGSEIPEIRFAGYTYAWEQHRLGETVQLRGRIGFRGYRESDLVSPGKGTITFSPADIDESGFISQDKNKYLSWEKYEESPEIKVYPGDILFTKTASIGKIGYVHTLKERATINPQFALLTPYENTDGYFIFLSIRNVQFMKQVNGITGGSSVPTMSQEQLKGLVFEMPMKPEQQQIGNLFRLLDRLTSLHQRKYSQLQNVKRAMLQKMFV